MPPKKQTAKALAAELKKQNILQAMEVVAQLKSEMHKCGSDSTAKEPAKTKSMKSVTADSDKKRNFRAKDIVTKQTSETIRSVQDEVSTIYRGGQPTIKSTSNVTETVDIGSTVKMLENPETSTQTKKKSETTDSNKKRSALDKDIAAKFKRTSETTRSVHDTVLTIEAKAKSTMKPTSKLTEMVDTGSIAKMAANPETATQVEASSKALETKSIKSLKPCSNESRILSSAFKAANKKYVHPSKPYRPHGAAYQYEIDCKQVSDSIDVNDLRKHLEKHLKVDGKKSNVGTTVSILCEGQKVILKSETFFPKKSLRFLSKKFLRKNWNIRVLSKNAHSYEYKYVGAP